MALGSVDAASRWASRFWASAIWVRSMRAAPPGLLRLRGGDGGGGVGARPKSEAVEGWSCERFVPRWSAARSAIVADQSVVSFVALRISDDVNFWMLTGVGIGN